MTAATASCSGCASVCFFAWSRRRQAEARFRRQPRGRRRPARLLRRPRRHLRCGSLNVVRDRCGRTTALRLASAALHLRTARRRARIRQKVDSKAVTVTAIRRRPVTVPAVLRCFWAAGRRRAAALLASICAPHRRNHETRAVHRSRVHLRALSCVGDAAFPAHGTSTSSALVWEAGCRRGGCREAAWLVQRSGCVLFAKLSSWQPTSWGKAQHLSSP